jgi:hypothetical protein
VHDQDLSRTCTTCLGVNVLDSQFQHKSTREGSGDETDGVWGICVGR